jgi:AcrR family transcriptional regulator
MAEVYHPTKLKLIETTAELLHEMPRTEISSEMILSKSGISKGSMYHHFEDLDHLIEMALLERYAKWIDVSVSLMTKILTSAKSSADILQGLSEVTKQTQDISFKSERFFRAEILVMAQQSPRFFKELSTLQDRLTDSLTDLVREAQERGFYKKAIDARAIAVFIQAYTLGKIIDDSSENPVDPDAYAHLINTIIKDVFLEN